jgi:hypothetical protein
MQPVRDEMAFGGVFFERRATRGPSGLATCEPSVDQSNYNALLESRVESDGGLKIEVIDDRGHDLQGE